MRAKHDKKSDGATDLLCVAQYTWLWSERATVSANTAIY